MNLLKSYKIGSFIIFPILLLGAFMSWGDVAAKFFIVMMLMYLVLLPFVLIFEKRISKQIIMEPNNPEVSYEPSSAQKGAKIGMKIGLSLGIIHGFLPLALGDMNAYAESMLLYLIIPLTIFYIVVLSIVGAILGKFWKYKIIKYLFIGFILVATAAIVGTLLGMKK